MRVLQILVLLFIFSTLANAQADCVYSFLFYVLDENGKSISNAEVEFKDRKLEYSGKAPAYHYSDFGGCGLKSGLLKIKAEGFDSFETEIAFRGYAAFELRLKAEGSENTAVFKNLGVLFGKIKKEENKSVSNAKVTLTDEQGKVSKTISDKNGKFHFIVDSGKYKLEINGIDRLMPKIIENLELSPKKYNDLDIVLETKK